MVNKFLYWANAAREWSSPSVWLAVHDPRPITKWLRLLESAGCTPSTMYNRVRGLRLACDYVYACFNLPKPRGLGELLAGKLSLYNRRRKDAARYHDIPSAAAETDLVQLNSQLFHTDDAEARLEQVLDRATSLPAGHRLQREEFLFVMRHCLALCQTSVACRPSALYTLTTAQVLAAADRSRTEGAGDQALLIPNGVHKTGSSRGPTVVVLGGAAKQALMDYLSHVRPRCPVEPNSDHVFLNSNGRPLTSSQVSTQLYRHQRVCGWKGKPVSCTEFRKAVVTRVRSQDRDGGRETQDTVDELAVTLNHSRQTQDTFYDRRRGRDSTLRVHRRIQSVLTGRVPPEWHYVWC